MATPSDLSGGRSRRRPEPRPHAFRVSPPCEPGRGNRTVVASDSTDPSSLEYTTMPASSRLRFRSPASPCRSPSSRHPSPGGHPSLGAIRPVGGQRGTEIEVTLSGARLGDAKEILYYQPGITTVSITKVDDNNVKAKLKIAADCPLGLHDLRVRTATGISELRTFSVGRAQGSRPRSSRTTTSPSPQPIPMNVDRQRRRRQRGRRLLRRRGQEGRADLGRGRGDAAGDHAFRPLRRDPEREAVRAGLERRRGPDLAGRRSPRSSRPRTASTSSRSARAPTPATAHCLYRLHVGNFPRPTGDRPGRRQARRDARGPLDRRPGRRGHVEVDPAGDDLDADFGLSRQDDKGISPYPNTFRLTPLGNVIENEPNDDHAACHAVHRPDGRQRRRSSKPGDVDHFVFNGKKGQVFDIHCLRPADPLAARLGHVPGQEGRRRRRSATTTRSARTATSASRPGRRRVRDLGRRPPRQGRARLRLPDRGQPGRAEARDDDRRRADPARHRRRWPCASPRATGRRS